MIVHRLPVPAVQMSALKPALPRLRLMRRVASSSSRPSVQTTSKSRLVQNAQRVAGGHFLDRPAQAVDLQIRGARCFRPSGSQ